MAEMDDPTTPAPEPGTPAADPAPEALAEAAAAPDAAVAGAAAAVAGAAAVAVEPEEEEDEDRRRRWLILFFLLLLLLLLLGILAGWYLLFRRPIEDIIPPIGSEVVPTYSTSLYGASKPMGVAVSTTGDRIFVTESAGDRTTKVFDDGGNVIGVLDPPEDNTNHAPVYVAVNPADDSVYVSDRATGKIYVYSKQGEYVRDFKPVVEIPNWQPLGLAFSADGDLWVTDLSAPYHRIEVFGLDGTLKREIGNEGQFNFPNLVAFDEAGNAYVTNSNDGRLMILEPTTGTELAGISRGAAEGNLGLPRGVAVDDRLHLFVVDATGQTIHMYRIGTTADWRPVFIGNFGTDGIEDGQFEYPNGIAVDRRGHVYVTDRENDRVQVWGF
jgi:sugar lactone lactonase YvrE